MTVQVGDLTNGGEDSGVGVVHYHRYSGLTYPKLIARMVGGILARFGT